MVTVSRIDPPMEAILSSLVNPLMVIKLTLLIINKFPPIDALDDVNEFIIVFNSFS
jgi:hypothetical protein